MYQGVHNTFCTSTKCFFLPPWSHITSSQLPNSEKLALRELVHTKTSPEREVLAATGTIKNTHFYSPTKTVAGVLGKKEVMSPNVPYVLQLQFRSVHCVRQLYCPLLSICTCLLLSVQRYSWLKENSSYIKLLGGKTVDFYKETLLLYFLPVLSIRVSYNSVVIGGKLSL